MPRFLPLVLLLLAVVVAGGCEPKVKGFSQQIVGTGVVSEPLDPFCNYRVMAFLTIPGGGIPDSLQFDTEARIAASDSIRDLVAGSRFIIRTEAQTDTVVLPSQVEGQPYPNPTPRGAMFYLSEPGEGSDSISIRYDLTTADPEIDVHLDVWVDPVSICAPW